VTNRIAVLPIAAALLLGACDAATPDPFAAGTPEAGRLEGDPGFRAAAHHSGVEPSVFRFRSEEDPAYPPDPAVCAAAPFTANVQLGASLWTEAVNAAHGVVVHPMVRRLGTATACVRITDPTFTPGVAQPFYAQFDIPEGRVTAEGHCSVVSNDVPSPGLVLAGCFLRATGVPHGYAGGAVTSLSVFNPASLPGFTTGSVWTVQLYPSQD
jgi:hypothetical protein